LEVLRKQKVTDLIDLTGKTAIVTGGALGIGRGIAYRLAEAGANVLISDINEEAARKTETEFKKKGFKVKAIKADASKVEEANRTVDTAVREFGSLDILVNNAGIYPMAPALESSEGLWNKVFDLNVKGVFFHSQAAAKKMKELGKKGKIINLASVDAYHPTGNLAHYDASKGGVVMMTKALALELADHNIQVNAIAPGGISTEGSATISGEAMEDMRRSGMGPEQIQETFTARIPLKRMGNPDDIGKAALFLASDLSSYMTGSTIKVDGGYLLS